MQKAKFNVPSISCSACSNKIQQGIKELDGIGNVSVDLKSQEVQVDYDPADTNPQTIKNKIASLGYDVVL